MTAIAVINLAYETLHGSLINVLKKYKYMQRWQMLPDQIILSSDFFIAQIYQDTRVLGCVEHYILLEVGKESKSPNVFLKDLSTVADTKILENISLEYLFLLLYRQHQCRPFGTLDVQILKIIFIMIKYWVVKVNKQFLILLLVK